jgi:GT2 family glycosyltransferase
MVRADVFDRIGGMDERFHPAWFEDVDFCLRLHRAGFVIRYEPSARFVHRGGVAVDVLGEEGFSRAFYRNMLRYVRKQHGLGASLVVRLLIAAGMAERAPAAVMRGNRAALAAAVATWIDALFWWHAGRMGPHMDADVLIRR